jgi:hypothetical protein
VGIVDASNPAIVGGNSFYLRLLGKNATGEFVILIRGRLDLLYECSRRPHPPAPSPKVGRRGAKFKVFLSRYKGEGGIRAVGINFGFSGPDGVNDIARSDISTTFDPKAQSTQGTITVRSYALNANPLAEQGSVVGTFPFTGQRITTD